MVNNSLTQVQPHSHSGGMGQQQGQQQFFTNLKQGLESAFKGTDQFKAYDEYQRALAPTQAEIAKQQEMQIAIQNSDPWKAMNTYQQSMSPTQEEITKLDQLRQTFMGTDEFQDYNNFGQNFQNAFRYNQGPQQGLQQGLGAVDLTQSPFQPIHLGQQSGNQQQFSPNSMNAFGDKFLTGLGDLFEKYFPLQDSTPPQVNNQEQGPMFDAAGNPLQQDKKAQVFGNMLTPADRQFG